MKFGIDLLRHIFCIGVIIQHMTSSRYSLETLQDLTAIRDWVDGAVAGFFFISGYLMKSGISCSVYAKKQVIRLMVPFFIFSLVYAVALAVLGKGSLYDGVISTLTLHGAGMQLYYLPYLLLVTVSYMAISNNLIKDKKTGPAVIALVLLAICVFLPTTGSTGAEYKLIPFYYLSFVLGSSYKSISTYQHRLSLSMFVLFGLTILGFFDHRFFDLVLVCSLFLVIEKYKNWFPDSRLPGSGGVYLLHTPVINFAMSIFLTSIGIVELTNVSVSVIFTYIVCLMLTIVFIKLRFQNRALLLE